MAQAFSLRHSFCPTTCMRRQRPSNTRQRHTEKPPNNSKQTPFERELNTKRRGELSELAFALAATRRGFVVSKPFGDCQRYDVVLDPSRTEDQPIPQPCPCEFCTNVATAGSIGTAAPSLSLRSVQRQGCGKQQKTPTPKQLRPSKRYNQTEHHQNFYRPRQPLLRIQVKSSTQMIHGLYRINSGRRLNGRVVPYKLSEIDFIAAHIIPEDSWFILPLAHVLGQVSLLFRPKKSRQPGLYDNYREAWHYLTQPGSLEFA
jgi:PD-(D/E)XK nuclease superfamily protein